MPPRDEWWILAGPRERFPELFREVFQSDRFRGSILALPSVRCSPRLEDRQPHCLSESGLRSSRFWSEPPPSVNRACPDASSFRGVRARAERFSFATLSDRWLQ